MNRWTTRSSSFRGATHGGLLEHANESTALQAIIRISKLPEKEARQLFLSGQPRRIKEADTRDVLDKAVEYLRKTGVDVLVQEVNEELNSNEGVDSSKVSHSKLRISRINYVTYSLCAVIAALGLMLFASAIISTLPQNTSILI